MSGFPDERVGQELVDHESDGSTQELEIFLATKTNVSTTVCFTC